MLLYNKNKLYNIQEDLDAFDLKEIVFFIKNLGDNEMILLKNILKALNISLENIQLIKNEKAFQFRQFNFTPFSKFIFFGYRPKDLELNIEIAPYQIVNFQKAYLLFSHELSSIEKDRNLKLALWKSLQLLFEPKTSL